jgi:ketosteroid isomerase-like protein
MTGPTVEGSIRGELAAANERMMAAFGRGDAAGVTACYTADGQLPPSHSEVVEGHAAIEQYWGGAMAAGITGIRLETVEATAAGDAAHEVGRYTLRAGDVEVDRGKYVVIWRREGGACGGSTATSGTAACRGRPSVRVDRGGNEQGVAAAGLFRVHPVRDPLRAGRDRDAEIRRAARTDGRTLGRGAGEAPPSPTCARDGWSGRARPAAPLRPRPIGPGRRRRGARLDDPPRRSDHPTPRVDPRRASRRPRRRSHEPPSSHHDAIMAARRQAVLFRQIVPPSHDPGHLSFFGGGCPSPARLPVAVRGRPRSASRGDQLPHANRLRPHPATRSLGLYARPRRAYVFHKATRTRSAATTSPAGRRLGRAGLHPRRSGGLRVALDLAVADSRTPDSPRLLPKWALRPGAVQAVPFRTTRRRWR